QALADQSGTVDWPIHRLLYTNIQQDVRTQLGPARFEAMFKAGHKLTVAEAGELALTAPRGVPPTTTRPPEPRSPRTLLNARLAHQSVARPRDQDRPGPIPGPGPTLRLR